MEQTSTKPRSTTFRTLVQVVYGFLAFVGAITLLILYVAYEYSYDDMFFVGEGNKNDELIERLDTALSNQSCNVLGIELHGAISTYLPGDSSFITEETFDAVASEDIVAMIEYAERNEQIEAILIEVDSYGGLPVAAEEIANTIKYTEKPVVAYVRSGGVSAAYWAISPADVIFASPVSDVGSIGVTQSYVETAGESLEAGRVYREISSGAFKNTGDPEKVLTEAERDLLLQGVLATNEVFISAVAENRALPTDFVRTLADGSSVLGLEAVELGLVDKLGDGHTALIEIETLLEKESSVCW